jgi:hypothetical protein
MGMISFLLGSYSGHLVSSCCDRRIWKAIMSYQPSAPPVGLLNLKKKKKKKREKKNRALGIEP